MDKARLLAHLTEKHAYEKRTQATCTLDIAMDMEREYRNVFTWTIHCPAGEVKVIQVSSGPK